MRILASLLSLCACVQPLWADTVVATRTIRAQQIVMADDLRLVAGETPGMAGEIAQIAGFEARRILYAGRPVSPRDVGPPALVERNQIVLLGFRVGGLKITTDGRAMARGGEGDRVRVINLSSRTTVSGTIDANGTVWVGQ